MKFCSNLFQNWQEYHYLDKGDLSWGHSAPEWVGGVIQLEWYSRENLAELFQRSAENLSCSLKLHNIFLIDGGTHLHFLWWELMGALMYMVGDTHLPCIYNLLPYDDLCRRGVFWPLTLLFSLFLAVTEQLVEHFFLSVCLSVRLSHHFHYVPITVSSQNFLELLPLADMMSMQQVKVRGQRSRSHGTKNHRFWPKLGVSGL